MVAGSKPFATERALQGVRAMELLDEAVALLRQTPLAIHLIYFVGALPFCLALLCFVFDMIESAHAVHRLAVEAGLLTVFYFWMKTCQAVFSRQLLAFLEGEDAEPWTVSRWAQTALLQTIYAGTFCIVYPLTLCVMLPYGWVTAFYHSISIVATGSKSTLRSSFKEAYALSMQWPKQNHLVLSALLAALLFLFINVGVFIAMVPRLLNMLLGLSTVFDQSAKAWTNSSFFLEVSVFCFLVLNPLNKAIYVLRSFYARSRLNGADLHAGLRRQALLRREQVSGRALALLIMVAILFSPAPVQADEAASSPSASAQSPTASNKLDDAIEKTLLKDEYAWRSPHRAVATAEDNWLLRAIRKFQELVGKEVKAVMDTFVKFIRWLFHQDKQNDSPSKPAGGPTSFPWEILFLLALVLVVAGLAFFLMHYLRRAKPALPVLSTTTPVKTVDLEADDVRADELPEDSWLALAQELIEKGEMRLALRAFYLATLSILAQKQLIRLAAAKSNRDYLLELTRRLRGNIAAVTPFQENVRLFEASWYGTHAVTTGIIDVMRVNHHHVRDHATA